MVTVLLLINIGLLVYVVRRLGKETAALGPHENDPVREHLVLRDERIAQEILKRARQGGDKT